jgi:hypothetical protein
MAAQGTERGKTANEAGKFVSYSGSGSICSVAACESGFEYAVRCEVLIARMTLQSTARRRTGRKKARTAPLEAL